MKLIFKKAFGITETPSDIAMVFFELTESAFKVTVGNHDRHIDKTERETKEAANPPGFLFWKSPSLTSTNPCLIGAVVLKKAVLKKGGITTTRTRNVGCLVNHCAILDRPNDPSENRRISRRISPQSCLPSFVNHFTVETIETKG